MRSKLEGERPDPSSLVGQVTETSLIEYLVRAGQYDEAAVLIRAAVDRSHERARLFFSECLDSFRREGLPVERPHGGSALLAYAVARFDLPVGHLDDEVDR